MAIHQIASKTTGKAYEVQKMRLPDSFYLPAWYYRRAGDGPYDWTLLPNADTLREVKQELHG